MAHITLVHYLSLNLSSLVNAHITECTISLRWWSVDIAFPWSRGIPELYAHYYLGSQPL